MASRFCEEQARWSESGARGLQVHVYGQYKTYLGDFCQLLTFANSLDPDRAQQKVSRDQFPNRLTLGPWFKLFIFVSGRAVQALKRCSDCVFSENAFFLPNVLSEISHNPRLSHFQAKEDSVELMPMHSRA